MLKTKRVLFVIMATVIVGMSLYQSQTTEAVVPSDDCFNFSSGVIYDYYDNELDDPINAACPRDVTIPSSIAGETVHTIAADSFAYKQLTEVTIPSSVTEIGNLAFRDNELVSIVIPDSVTVLGDSAFSENQITSMVLPANITTIPFGLFNDNKLSVVTIPSTVTTIDNWAFAYNEITSLTIPNSVTTIGGAAFLNNLLTDVTLPNSLTTIDGWAFDTNELTSITIPNSVTTLGVGAFMRNYITSATLPANITTIPDQLFTFNNLTTITIPNSVTTIGESAFDVNELTSVTIPNSVTAISVNAFSLNKISTITLPDSVTVLEPSAFSWQAQRTSDARSFLTDLWGSDPALVQQAYEQLIFTQVFTADPGNPNSLEDGLIFDGLMFDGVNVDPVTAGGHLINPAAITAQYTDTNGNTLSPQKHFTGFDAASNQPLESYFASKGPTISQPADPFNPTPQEYQNALAVLTSSYWRLSQTQSTSAPAISGYTLQSPASPQSLLLASVNTAVTFVYAVATNTGSPISTPGTTQPSAGATPNTGLQKVAAASLLAVFGVGGLLIVGNSIHRVRAIRIHYRR